MYFRVLGALETFANGTFTFRTILIISLVAESKDSVLTLQLRSF